jgi:Rps23 Pro-64 3,4-dihydroxylase Tpa1-like proline 4-hydroxylase
MIQITRCGTQIDLTQDDRERLRSEFAQQQAIRLPRFVAPDLLRLVMDRVVKSPFRDAEWEEQRVVGTRQVAEDHCVVALLHLLCTEAKLRALAEELTGCGPVKGFYGRLYRLLPDSGQEIRWHDDLSDTDRLLALSMNLSPEPFEGGVLTLRRKDSHEVLFEYANQGKGDAVLFRVAPHLQHRVSEVRGTALRMAFAGWFVSKSNSMVPARPAAVGP